MIDTVITKSLAVKLDESPRVINNWRHAWRLPSIKFGTWGSGLGFLMAIAQYEAAVSPLFGIIPQWSLWCLVGFAAIAAIVIRLTKKPGAPDLPKQP